MRHVEETFRQIAAGVALAVEAAAILVIAFASLQAVWGLVMTRSEIHRPGQGVRGIWIRFGQWLLLGLEFQLAADVVRSSVTPTWDDIGKLGAIALIRTFLGYFLTKDIKEFTVDTEGSKG